MAVKPVPDGYHTVTPYLIVRGAAGAIDFFKRAFGAAELFRMDAGGRIMHAEIQVGDSRVMLADEMPEMGALAPQTAGGTPVGLLLYLPDVDAVFARAVAAGARPERPVKDQFYGDRAGTVIDPYGHKWTIATHVEDVSPEEIDRRFSAMAKGQGG